MTNIKPQDFFLRKFPAALLDIVSVCAVFFNLNKC